MSYRDIADLSSNIKFDFEKTHAFSLYDSDGWGIRRLPDLFVVGRHFIPGNELPGYIAAASLRLVMIF